MSTFLRGVCATLLVWCLPGALLSAQDKGKTPDDDPELRLVRAEIGLLAERINRAGSLLEAEMQGKEVRTDLEKARTEKLAASKEVADYKAASERLLGLVKEREKALGEASEAGT